MFRMILVPVDSSEHASKAVNMAGEIASKFGAKIILLNVMHQDIGFSADGDYFKSPPQKKLITNAIEILKKEAALLERFPQLEVKKKVATGDPALKILEFAEKASIDLIIMGSKGLTGVKRFMIGSVSAKVVQHANCPVMVVKEN